MSVPADRIVPFNIEAEEAVLGSLLLDSQAIIRIASFLRYDDFYRDKNRWVYEAAMALYERREPIDFLTVRAELERDGRLDDVGGPSFLASLLNAVPTSIHIEHYARIVERAATRRRLISAASDIAMIAYDESDEVEATLDKAEQIIFAVSQRSLTRDLTPISQVLNEYFDKLEYLQDHRGQVSGVPTGFADLNKLLGGFQRSDLIIVAARPGMGKCVAYDTPIIEASSGEVITAEELYRRGRDGGEVSVFSLSEGGRLVKANPSAYLDDGIKPVFRVRTRLGREIKTTLTHPFLTFQGWRPLGELEPGARIAVPRHLPVFGQERRPEAEVILLAYLIGDGGLTHSTPRMTTVSDSIVRELHECAAAFGLTVQADLRPERAPTYSLVGQKGRANPLTDCLKQHGVWGKLARDKEIPAAVYRLPQDQLALFLNRLFSTDGSAYIASPRGMAKTFARISYSSTSKKLAQGVQHLLLRFGINAKLRQKRVKYRAGYRLAYELEIMHSADMQRFVQAIGALGKEEVMQAIARHTEQRRSNVNRDNLPQAVWEPILTAKGERSWADVSAAAGRPRNYNWHVGKRGPSRGLLAELAQALTAPDIQALAESDIYWDEIVAIEFVGQEQVYDLTIPVTHNFVAADFYVHNTGLLLSFAHSAAMSGDPIAIFSLEMAAEQLVQRLLSGETGIDQHRLRTGLIRDDEMSAVTKAMGRLEQAPIYIDDTPGITALEMRTKARRLHAERPLGLIVVDYLQLMHGGGRMENRVQEISGISRALKELARELNVPVVAASQLSRAVESRHDRRPMLSDLRESGCLAGDTLIYLPDRGIYRPIEQLVGQQDFNVLALNRDTWRLEARPVSHAFSTGRKPVFRLATRLGREIRATANHQFLTIEGWRRLDELAVGQCLALPRTLPGPIEPSISNAELALLGHLIGDGCTLPRHAIQYTTQEPALAETVIQLALEVFGDRVRPRIQRERAWYQVYLAASERLTHGVSNPVATWLREMGVFGLRSYEKRVPDAVFRQPSAGIALFLRHLWATDGCIHLSEGKSHYANVYYASSSPRLARDVQSLLLRLGICARLSRLGQSGKGRDQFHVTISGKPDIARFLDEVGGLGEQKLLHQAAIEARFGELVANTNRDIIPREAWRQIAVPAMQAAGLTSRGMQASLGNAYCGTALYKQNLSRERAARLAYVVVSQELARLATSDVYWDGIVAIEPDGEADVYDLTVDGLHNFVANDIVAHNSIEQDADIVMFIYRDDYYKEQTEKRNIAEVIVAKHRNGPTDTVELFFIKEQARFADLAPIADEYADSFE